jgi:hypothetical protein
MPSSTHPATSADRDDPIHACAGAVYAPPDDDSLAPGDSSPTLLSHTAPPPRRRRPHSSPGLIFRSIRCPSAFHHACAAGPGDRHRGASRAAPQAPAKCGPAAANGPMAFAALPISETAKSRCSAVPASTSAEGRDLHAPRPARRVRCLADMCIRGPTAARVSSSGHHPCAHGVAGATELGATG